MKKLENDEKRKLYNMQRIVAKVLKFIGNTIFLFSIILVAIIIFSSLNGKLKKQVPSFAGYKFYVVLSQSMRPKVDVGSLVIVKTMNPSNLHKGDIITFTNINLHAETTTHRIVDIKNENTLSFITKGDANNGNDDSLVLANNVVGKVVFSIPYIGKLFYFLKTRLGIITLIVIPSLCIVILQFIKLLRYIHKTDRVEENNS